MTLFRHTTRARRRIARLAAVGGVLALVAAGCGSSSSSSSSSAPAGSSGPGSSSNAANTSTPSVSPAQAVVTQASVRPTSITVTTPVGKPAATGKKLVFISCGIAVCAQQGKIVAQAAASLGWESSTIATDGSPTSVQGAYDTAIRQGANGIVTTAAIRAELGAQIPQLVAKGIAVSDASSTDPVSAPFIYNTSTATQNATIGKYLAAEIAVNSKGKANTVYVNLPAYTILGPLGASFKSFYKQYCPSCGYASIDVSLTQIPNAPSIIVSYLRSHPSVNYVALSVADALDTGLPAALSAAGLSNIGIVGQGGGPTDWQNLATGKELAFVPYDYYSVDYQMVDALVRHFAGASVQLTPPPLWLMTKANAPSDLSQLFPIVANYKSQFLKLWGK
jgi:ribose transport system substrate-binding protein